MREHRPPPPADPPWQDTSLDAPGSAEAPLPAPPGSSRPQPPLQEVLEGLDARELQGQTVFDQFFGPLPPAKPRPRKG